ncbi:MAG: glutaredoxin family protein [Aquincola sp.]|nr:glutaredoxin family protein [Aquincola sp.]
MAASRPSARSLLGLVLLIAAISGGTQWWHATAQQRAAERLVAVARPGDIRLISSTTCAYCTQARLWLQKHRVPFEECFIEQDSACQATFQAHLAPGTPLVLVAGGRALLGFDPQQVLQALAGLNRS